MKKSLVALCGVAVSLTLMASTSFGAVGFFGTGGGFTILNLNGAGNVFYSSDGSLDTGLNPALPGADLGTFNLFTDTLVLDGGESQTFKNDNAPNPPNDVTGGDLNYSVAASGGSHSFSAINLPFSANLPNPGDQRWQETGQAINLLAGLTPGNYELQVFHRGTSNGGDFFLNNGGNNYTATFTVTPEPSRALFLLFGLAGVVLRRRR
ncbi:MAG: PEP-CTERM sorting domain-containing protein [Verrucomicrobiota bacterium]